MIWNRIHSFNGGCMALVLTPAIELRHALLEHLREGKADHA